MSSVSVKDIMDLNEKYNPNGILWKRLEEQMLADLEGQNVSLKTILSQRAAEIFIQLRQQLAYPESIGAKGRTMRL